MIEINCTNCKSLLQIDDAFAGGVCRCRHCGTIQTVPKRLKPASVGADASAPPEPAKDAGSSKSLYSKSRLPDAVGSGTGLDDLAGIVASSGLTSSRLQKKPAPPPSSDAPTKAWDRKIVLIVASAGAVIALLLGVIIFLAVRDRTVDGGDAQSVPNVGNSGSGSGSSKTDSGSGEGTGRPLPPTSKLAQFLGDPIGEKSVAYVIDRGASSGEEGRLDLIKAALLRSLESLGPERQFKIVFWTIDNGDIPTWPKSGTKLATAENIAEVRTLLDSDIYPYGATDVSAALEKALKNNPEVVMLVPIKSIPPDATSFSNQVLDKYRSLKSAAKIRCYSLAQPLWAAALEAIGPRTGGSYQDVPLAKLRQYAGQ